MVIVHLMPERHKIKLGLVLVVAEKSSTTHGSVLLFIIALADWHVLQSDI